MAHEFSLIKAIQDKIHHINAQHKKTLLVPPGDDAALLAGLSRPVITTDCQRENVHFKHDWQRWEDIGYKAVMVTLSDLAASYAQPVSVFVNLGLPDGVDEASVLRLYDGMSDAFDVCPCALGGGNVAKARTLSLDLFAVGQGHHSLFPLRSLAKPGHGLYVSGPLGMARAGLDALQHKRDLETDIITAFKRPRARFDAALILADHGVNCVMDISDGLAGDALHMAEASGISIRFTLDFSCASPSLIEYCNRYDLFAVDMMLAGGEDYELLFACDAKTFESIQCKLPGAYRVGHCLDLQDRHLINPPTRGTSFVHQTDDGAP